MIHKILRTIRNYKLHVKHKKDVNKGYNKAYDSAWKRPMFYVINLVGGTIIISITSLIQHYGNNIVLDTTDTSLLVALLCLGLMSIVLFNWIEKEVLNPKGYSMNSKKEGKKL